LKQNARCGATLDFRRACGKCGNAPETRGTAGSGGRREAALWREGEERTDLGPRDRNCEKALLKLGSIEDSGEELQSLAAAVRCGSERFAPATRSVHQRKEPGVWT